MCEILKREDMMKLLSNQFGRSMIEMLGVLAIVGVLSVGGITAYSKAMMTIKINKLTDEWTMFLNELPIYEKDLIKIGLKKEEKYINLTNSLSKITNLIPYHWQISAYYIYDSLGNNFQLAFSNEENGERSHKLYIDYILNQNTPKKICAEFILRIIKPNSSRLVSINTYRKGQDNSTAVSTFWGDNYCAPHPSRCLNSISIAQVYDMCSVCEDDDIRCLLSFPFE